VIPDLYTPELRACTRWLNSASTSKIPLAAGLPVNAFDPNNWVQYAELRDPRHACLVIDAPFVGVDFDWKNKDSGEDSERKQRAVALIGELPLTYSERSLSGCGAHFWYRCAEHAKLPDCSIGEFEVYARKRQFRMTANVWPRAVREVTELTLDEALAIFHLAEPTPSVESNRHDDASGFWCERSLLAMLEAFARHVPGFWFRRCRQGYAVPCPGDIGGLGWSDGAKHSPGRLVQDSLIWVGDGHRRWRCFHAHCASKTTLDWLKFYDPLQLWFSHDRWEEGEMKRLGLGGVL